MLNCAENNYWRTLWSGSKNKISHRLITSFFWQLRYLLGQVSPHIYTRRDSFSKMKQKIIFKQQSVIKLIWFISHITHSPNAPCSWPQSDLWVWTSVNNNSKKKIICFTNFSLSTAFSGMCGFADVLYHEKLFRMSLYWFWDHVFD